MSKRSCGAALIAAAFALMGAAPELSEKELRELEKGEVLLRTVVDPSIEKDKFAQCIAIYEAPREVVWRAIKDYNRYAEFMPTVKETYIEAEGEGYIDLYQKLDVPFFRDQWYVRRIVHDDENFVQRWTFVRGSISDTRGALILYPHEKGTLAVQMVYFRPGFWAPEFLLLRFSKRTFRPAVKSLRERALLPEYQSAAQ